MTYRDLRSIQEIGADEGNLPIVESGMRPTQYTLTTTTQDTTAKEFSVAGKS